MNHVILIKSGGQEIDEEEDDEEDDDLKYQLTGVLKCGQFLSDIVRSVGKRNITS